MERLAKKEKTSIWKGSLRTMSEIAYQIFQRWGEEAAKEYQPEVNCFTFRGWQQRGYKVKKGEKALKTSTYIQTPNEPTEDGKITWSCYPKAVCLFYKNQVELR